MRKKRFTKTIGILISEEAFDKLVEVTDKEEITISTFIRRLIDERLNLAGGEKYDE
jgi:predicted CopG family antitoxin